jgi:release factor glutamine methyltransferase
VSTVLVESTVGRLLGESGLPRSEAERLLGFVLGRDRAYLIGHAEEPIGAAHARAAQDGFARRRSGEPVAHIIGCREFYGLNLRVTPDVLIPRPETEHLVELALERIPVDSATRALELGTGSGAVAIALAAERPMLKITATDLSEAALDVARENARRHRVAIELVQGDWFEAPLPGQFDLIVSNPPYVAAGDPHLEEGDVRFEPRLALEGGGDGLLCIGKIAAQARAHLHPGGWLLLEHGYDQRGRCAGLLEELGYAEVADYPDLAGLPRVCVGRRPG